MIDVNQLRKGATFTLDNKIYKVLEYSHNKPGRGNATIRTTVRDLRSGSVTTMTFNSGDRVEDIRVEGREVEYLYADDEFLTFMDLETYDQPHLRRDVFGDDFLYLTEGLNLVLNTWQEEVIDYQLPSTVEHEIVDGEMAIAGDTATNANKKVKTQTGLEVAVPLFVNVGDRIRIKTEDGSYVTRV
jgi:elongation factor P